MSDSLEEEFIDMAEAASRMSMSDNRLGLLIEAGAIPRMQFNDKLGRSGWQVKDLIASNYIQNLEEWNLELPHTYGISRVYYIAVEQFVKIGYTDNIRNKLLSIKSYCPFDATLLHDEPGDRSLEKARHDQLSWARHRNEWFKRAPVERFLEHLMNNRKMIPSGQKVKPLKSLEKC